MRFSTAKLLRILITVWSSAVLAIYIFLGKNDLPQKLKIKSTVEINIQKIKAFEVLEQKCNTCHKTENPSRVFTLENMDDLAPKIYRQVFVFKRMPIGKKLRKEMTEEEYSKLKNWLDQNLKRT